MNSGQEQFFAYILDCVQENHVEDARNLLLENFKAQAEQNFSNEDLEKFNKTLEGMLKSEKKDEVMAILSKFGKDHVTK